LTRRGNGELLKKNIRLFSLSHGCQ